jgi:RNA polymerase sigma-70 factor (ECF subfamily)
MVPQQVERFETLILPHLDDAYTLARYLLRDEHDAQDAVQDAALRAFRFFAGFRDGDARAWFLAIVRNCCRTWQRRQRRDRLNTTLTHDHASELAAEIATDTLAVDRSERAAIARAIDALPTEFREVIVLRELQGLSYAEIARVIGLPVGTVMSRLSRARRRVATALGQTQEAS